MISLFAKTISLLAVTGLMTGGLMGCGPGGPPEPERAVVFGEVTYQGKPIQDGVIRFISDAGPSAQGPIRAGVYRIDHKGGVPVGDCRVEIEAYQEQDIKDVGTTLIEMPKRIGVQILPERYNTKSTLRIDIVSGQQNEHDFNL